MNHRADSSPPTDIWAPLDFWKHSEMFGELGDSSLLDIGNMEFSAGGIVSTAADCLRFMQGLQGGELISEATFASMRDVVETPALGNPEGEERAYYGLGWAEHDRGGFRIAGHGGFYNGWSAGLYWVPGCDLNLVFLANRGFVRDRLVVDRLVGSMCVGIGEASRD